MDGPSHIHTSAAIIYQKQLLYDAALVHLVHVGLIAAFAFDMQNYAQFINAAMRAFSPRHKTPPSTENPLPHSLSQHFHFYGSAIFRSRKFKYCFPSFEKNTTMVPKLKLSS